MQSRPINQTPVREELRRKHAFNTVPGRGYTRSMTQELRNEDAGRYLVTTATGNEYLIDLTARTVKRQMAATAPLVDFLDAGFSQLRRDGEPLELLMLETCAVGTSATLGLRSATITYRSE